MAGFEKVFMTLESGSYIKIHAWDSHHDAHPLVIVAPNSSAVDWDDFVAFLAPSHSPILANVSSSLELLMLIWKIGEPVLIMAQGQRAVDIASILVATAPAAAARIIVCDGEIRSNKVDDTHEISTLILRGRQSKTLSHATAVKMHESLNNSTLIEPENCGDFPAKDNPDAAASAINMFLSGASGSFNEESETDPIDPKL